MWTRMLVAATVSAAATLALIGCSASAPVSAGETSAPASTPTPTAQTDTPEQIASVVAKYEGDWQEVIDAAGDCRFGWAFGDEDLEYASCYLREQTLVATAQIALRDWSTLKAPSSMTSIVADTSEVLATIGGIDLTGVCGEELFPNDTDACTTALGQLSLAYSALDTQLAAWGPYL